MNDGSFTFGYGVFYGVPGAGIIDAFFQKACHAFDRLIINHIIGQLEEGFDILIIAAFGLNASNLDITSLFQQFQKWPHFLLIEVVPVAYRKDFTGFGVKLEHPG